jgi:transposase
VDGLGNPVEFLLSPGNEHDSSHAIKLLAKTDVSQSNVLGDKAYGAKAIRDFIVLSNGRHTIPPPSNVKQPWDYDRHVYKGRHLVECFSQKNQVVSMCCNPLRQVG